MSKRYIIIICCVGLLVMLGQCGGKNTPSSEEVARYGEASLDKQTLTEAIPTGLNKADSSVLAQQFVDNWLKRQVLLAEARQREDIDQDEIATKVAEYEANLLVQALKQKQWDKENESKPALSELKKYHQDNPKIFQLEQSVAKAIFVKIDKSKEQVRDIRNMLKSTKQDRAKIREYCIKYAESYHLADTAWQAIKKIWKTNSPSLKEEKLPKNQGFWEQSDAKYFYFLKIVQLKSIGETAPFAFVKEDVQNWLLRKKRQARLTEWERQLYKNAQKEKGVKFYNLK